MQEYNRCLTCGDEIPNGCLYCVSCIEESEAEEGKNEALNILKEMQDEIEQMTDEELFSHLVDSSETFRRENMESVLHEEYEEMKNENNKDNTRQDLL